MSGSLTRLITRNWAIKLAALALALMLYVAVAAQQPVRIVAESGYQLQGGLAITPSMARIVGSDRALAAIESVTTVPTEIANVTGPFTRSLPIDTAPLGVVRIAPKEVTVSGDLSVI